MPSVTSSEVRSFIKPRNAYIANANEIGLAIRAHSKKPSTSQKLKGTPISSETLKAAQYVFWTLGPLYEKMPEMAANPQNPTIVKKTINNDTDWDSSLKVRTLVNANRDIDILYVCSNTQSNPVM
jgi:hypothetical protein